MLKRSGRNPSSILFSSKNIISISTVKAVAFFLLFLPFLSVKTQAQLPANVLVGYHENWNTELLSQAHANYNVINLAFALPKTTGPTGACTCDIIYTRPPGYASNAAFMTEIDALHAAGKKVILSLGGATGPIYLANATDRTTFVNSVNAIFATYSYKIDGIDLDLETTSMTNIPGSWTMSAPAAAQTNMVLGVQSIMANYLANTGKKMLLTMAPEVYYVNGALSSFQIGASGGIFLPILDGLRTELDLLMMQLYNAPGGVNAWNGTTYFEGTGDFATAMNETVVKGFTLLSGKGTFTGIPASKIAFGLPATPAASTAGSGFLAYTDICNAAKYFKGTIAKPGGWSYTMTASYPTLKGLMTWDIHEDKYVSTPSYAFATNYTCGFPAVAPVSLIHFDAARSGEHVALNWETASETDNDYFVIERSYDGESFAEIATVDGLGNSTTGKKYEYTEYNAAIGRIYYRLAQYDFDGTVHHSSIVTVESQQGETGLTLSSNPFDQALVVRLYGNENTEAIISITDCTGQLLQTYTIEGNKEISVGESLGSGLYILQFYAQGESTQYKIVKK